MGLSNQAPLRLNVAQVQAEFIVARHDYSICSKVHRTRKGAWQRFSQAHSFGGNRGACQAVNMLPTQISSFDKPLDSKSGIATFYLLREFAESPTDLLVYRQRQHTKMLFELSKNCKHLRGWDG